VRRTLYHVTPERNLTSITEFGVLALKSQGRRTGSYWVDEPRLLWAIAHVAVKWDVSPRSLAVVVGSFEGDDIERTAKPGVYFAGGDVDITWGFDFSGILADYLE